MGKTIKVIDLLKILLTQVGDIPKQVYFESYKYEYDSKENDYFCESLNFFLFMNVLGENLEINLDLSITIIEEDKEIELIPIEDFNISYNLGFIDYKNIEVLKNHLNKDFQRIFDTLDLLIENQKILEKAVNELKKGK